MRPYRTPAARAPEPEPADEASRLGRLRSVHLPAPTSRPRVVAASAALVCGLVAVPFGYGEFSVLALVGGAVALVPSLWSRLASEAVRVDLHEGGLVVHRGGARDAVLFEEVDEVWVEFLGSVARSWRAEIAALRIVDRAGRTHRVPTDLCAGARVAEWVEKRCSDPLLAEARAALASGEHLAFGKVRLERAGIAIGEQFAPWTELRLVREELDHIAFFRVPLLPWRSVGFDEVPHPSVFRQLVVDNAPDVKLRDGG